MASAFWATSTPFGHAAGTGAQVIDISGDGANNQCRLVTAAWDEAVAQGVTINGLPLMLKRPDGLRDIEDLALYFRVSVIGGLGAFLIPVQEKHQFAGAIRTKVLRWIAEQPRAPERLEPIRSQLRLPAIRPTRAEPRWCSTRPRARTGCRVDRSIGFVRRS